MAISKPITLPDDRGRFGDFGGKFVPETLMAALAELEEAYRQAKVDPDFQRRLYHLLHTYAGRPTALYFAENLSRHCAGAKIYLKREDLAHTGAHKINNALGQALLAQAMGKKRITLSLMDGPFEQARTVTAFRLIDLAAERGYDTTVFAYEAAVSLSFALQTKHANAVHGHDVDEEDHPLPREWVAALQKKAAANGGSLDWINCGLCVDERGVGESIEGGRRGSPADLWSSAEASDGVLVIPTR